MTDTTSLNRKRGNIKSQLTKLNNALTEGQNKMGIPELQVELDIVLNIERKFEELKDDYYKIETSLFEVDDDIQKLEISLKTSIHKLKTMKIDSVHNRSVNNSIINVQPKKAFIKLPKIPLPFFSGKFEERNLFKTQFNSLISENTELSENEKLHYLRGSLKGEALIIKTTDDNFSSRFKALEQRYEKNKYNGKVSVQLVASKSRASPTKETTIPRLELLGALLLSRLYCQVTDGLENLDNSMDLLPFLMIWKMVQIEENGHDLTSQSIFRMSFEKLLCLSSSEF
ncbi:hypothetical protein HNY73_008257 [Argiope bruennichi]|uniref:Uncharacterized protein n=1 Tax=Argiope bruennichi TaxID=94029 RepID=A0A8T0FB16_ARGBR|nr:hypothetical protein HNY73_008257 [Argiope bruennichi]